MKYAFVEYVERREKVNSIFESIVHEAQSNPDFEKLLQEAGFLGNLWNAGKKFVQGAWSGGGIKTGAQAAWSQMTGPKTQLQNAISSLNKALEAIKKDPNWSNSQTTGQVGKFPAMPLVNWLSDTIQELKNQESQFGNKELPTAAAAAAQTQTAQPAPGVPAGGATSKF